MIETILGLFIEFIFEFFGMIILELIAELGAQAFQGGFSPAGKNRHFLLSFIGWGALGAIAGAASLYFFPVHFFKTEIYRQFNLVITPVVAGLFMHYRGQWLEKRERETVGLDTFFFGFLFALVFALVRYRWAH